MSKHDALTEAQWQRQLVDLAAMLGFHWLHLRPGQTSHGWRVPVSGTLGEGWPDLVFVRERDRRILFVELKSGKGRLTEEQEYVLGVLRNAGCEVYAWWPTDIDDAAAVLMATGRPEVTP